MAGKGVLLKKDSTPGPVVGIDLGTTYSVVAACKGGKVQIFANDAGSRTTPSVVGFLDKECFVGNAAKDLAAVNQVFDAKRLIGRSWNDENIQRSRKLWPFEVVEEDGAPRIRADVGGAKETFAPEEISAMVLREVKKTAEASLDSEVTKAVVTVPAYFNERQRQATKDACRIAGLEVLAMINEPTAAAIAYGLDKNISNKKVFVFDLGGGTFDVSVMEIKGNDFRVIASGGDTHLGGQDFDVLLLEHCLKEIKRKCNVDVLASNDKEALQEVRKACEEAKRKLSVRAEATVPIFLPRQKVGERVIVTRACFETLCADLFNKTMTVAKQVLADSKVSQKDIDEVVLVGGSTRIPKVRSLLQDLFGGKDLRNSINPDEAVAYGAAVHAAVLNGDKFFDNLVKLKDVTPLSLGKDIVGGRFDAVIPRNTPIPCERTKTYYTVYNNQTSTVSRLYQGERPLVKDNHYLNKEYTITYPPKRAGAVSSNVTFSLDDSGLLTVTAVEPITGMIYEVTISQEEARVSEADVQKMLENTERFRKADLEEKRRVEAELRAKGIFS